MTDAKFLLAVLSDGKPHSQADLLRRSFEERGFGCTVHSRIAELREKGYVITCDRVPGKTRGEAWRYQLLGSLSEGDALRWSAGPDTNRPSPSESEFLAPPIPASPKQVPSQGGVQLGLDGLHRREHEAA